MSDTLNTSARVVANIALDEGNIPKIQEQGAVKELARVLSLDTVDPGCKQSVLRAVRLLCSDGECREDLRASDGFMAVIECLKSENEAVAQSALQTLEVLTQDSDPEFIQVLTMNGAIPYVVNLCSHLKVKVSRCALSVLLHCAKNCDGRVALGSAGGVETLAKHLNMSNPLFHEVVCALCSCCRDVLSRQRLRDCGGLEKLIGMLSKTEFASLHSDILSALICYYFDENTLKFMVKRLGLLKALTHHLHEMTLSPPSEGAAKQSEEMEQEEMKTDPSIRCQSVGAPSHAGTDEPLVHDSDCCSEGITDSEKSSAVTGSDCRSSYGELDSMEGAPEASSTPMDVDCKGCTEDADSVKDIVKDDDAAPPTTSEPLAMEVTEESLTTPPPAKKPRLQLDFDSSTPMPANFIDSLLSSPSPYQRQPKVESPFTGEFRATLETQVVLLLSRVSHLRDCLTALATPDILLAILSYYFSCGVPNVHIFKVLTRVFMNPHCFQDCLASLVPSTIYKNLSVPEEYLHPQSRSNSAVLLIGSPLPDSDSSQRQNTPSTFNCYSPLHFSPAITPGGHTPVLGSPPFSSGWPVFHSMTQELLERLSKVAESPYGQGVLAHMLLRGSDKEKQACCLALPLLCR